MVRTAESQQIIQHSAWIEVRLDRLIKNLNAIRRICRPSTEVMAVVKANGYGHGILEIARALDGNVAYFGVSSLAEALKLRESKFESPVFILSRILKDELPLALTEGITLTVSSVEEAKEISEQSQALKRRSPIHIKVDTGMGRLGIPFSDAVKAIEAIAALPALELEGIYTHFPTAEREDGFIERQVRDFGLIVQALDHKGIRFKYRHGANSAGCVKVHSPIFNMVRPGLMLYGIYPDPSLESDIALSGILSLKTKIISVKHAKAGQTVGYGRDFVASTPTTIGLVPLGYSQGYPFKASNRASVLLDGKRFPLAGRVSMDYLAVDFGNHSVQIGDTVTLIGEDGDDSIRVEELASWADTIPYEVVTRLATHLPRYHG